MKFIVEKGNGRGLKIEDIDRYIRYVYHIINNLFSYILLKIEIAYIIVFSLYLYRKKNIIYNTNCLV